MQYDNVTLDHQLDVDVLIWLLIIDDVPLLFSFLMPIVFLIILLMLSYLFLFCSMMLIMLILCASRCSLLNLYAIYAFDVVDASATFRLSSGGRLTEDEHKQVVVETVNLKAQELVVCKWCWKHLLFRTSML